MENVQLIRYSEQNLPGYQRTADTIYYDEKSKLQTSLSGVGKTEIIFGDGK